MNTLYEEYGLSTVLEGLNEYLIENSDKDQKAIFHQMQYIDTLKIPIQNDTRELWLYSSMNSLDDKMITCKLVHVDEKDFTIGVFDNDYNSIHFITASCINYWYNKGEIIYNLTKDCPYYYKLKVVA